MNSNNKYSFNDFEDGFEQTKVSNSDDFQMDFLQDYKIKYYELEEEFKNCVFEYESKIEQLINSLNSKNSLIEDLHFQLKDSKQEYEELNIKCNDDKYTIQVLEEKIFSIKKEYDKNLENLNQDLKELQEGLERRDQLSKEILYLKEKHEKTISEFNFIKNANDSLELKCDEYKETIAKLKQTIDFKEKEINLLSLQKKEIQNQLIKNSEIYGFQMSDNAFRNYSVTNIEGDISKLFQRKSTVLPEKRRCKKFIRKSTDGSEFSEKYKTLDSIFEDLESENNNELEENNVFNFENKKNFALKNNEEVELDNKNGINEAIYNTNDSVDVNQFDYQYPSKNKNTNEFQNNPFKFNSFIKGEKDNRNNSIKYDPKNNLDKILLDNNLKANRTSFKLPLNKLFLNDASANFNKDCSIQFNQTNNFENQIKYYDENNSTNYSKNFEITNQSIEIPNNKDKNSSLDVTRINSSQNCVEEKEKIENESKSQIEELKLKNIELQLNLANEIFLKDLELKKQQTKIRQMMEALEKMKIETKRIK